MRARLARPGLRATVTASFALGALALAVLMAAGTHLVARDYLVSQRERTAVRQALEHAVSVHDGLLTAGLPVSEALAAVAAPAEAGILLQRDGRWYSSSLALQDAAVPAALAAGVRAGDGGVAWTRTAQGPAVVVGVPLPSVGTDFYEVAVTAELERTLDALRVVLGAFAAVTAAAGALLGAWASRRLVAPLNTVAGTAARIAAGDLRTRLPATDDPELATIVGSFNSMVDALGERLEREARFTADVSHELRSPLTTLVTGVGVLQRRRSELPPRSQQALDLVGRELDRFSRTLEDLLELGRIDAGARPPDLVPVAAGALVRHALESGGRSPELLRPPVPEVRVSVDRHQLTRALVNLFDNADRHGGGLRQVQVHAEDRAVRVVVDDGGPGVEAAQRERVFERFARAGSRGSLPGAGLGLSLVMETVRAHGGAVWCTDAPGGGARFVVRLPASETDR